MPGLGTQSHCFPRPGAMTPDRTHSVCVYVLHEVQPCHMLIDTKLHLGTLLGSYPPYPLSLCKTDLLVFAELCHAAGPKNSLSAGNYLPHLEDNDMSFKWCFSNSPLCRPRTLPTAPLNSFSFARVIPPTPHTVTFFSRLLRAHSDGLVI